VKAPWQAMFQAFEGAIQQGHQPSDFTPVMEDGALWVSFCVVCQRSMLLNSFMLIGPMLTENCWTSERRNDDPAPPLDETDTPRCC
jgi:hypothetical protein